MEKLVDARGMACPLPVVHTKKAAESMAGGDILTVLVDNEIAVQNLQRFASHKGYPVSAEKRSEKEFAVIMNITGGAPAAQQEEAPACAPDIRRRGIVVVLSANTMGTGDPKLSTALMKAFVFALTRQDQLPETILCYNTGAYLTCEGADTLEDMKALEAEGYTFEDADGSLALRILGALNRRRQYFDILDFHVVSRKPEDDKNAQAYVKVRVGDQVEITADEGDGPVNALDCAVRKALSRFYPSLGGMKLIDFKVRVISEKGTASKVRVHMESSKQGRTWSTVGVSGNVIEASFIALTDSIEYMLMSES